MDPTATATHWQRPQFPKKFSIVQQHRRALFNFAIFIITKPFLVASAGCFIAAGALLFLRVNTIATLPLLGAGGVLLSTPFIAAIVLIVANVRFSKVVSYQIVTWTIGKNEDYNEIRSLHNLNNEMVQEEAVPNPLEETLRRYYQAPPPKLDDINKKEQDYRVEFCRTILIEGRKLPDIICLQECEFSQEKLSVILHGYDYCRFKFHSKTIIAWNPHKFVYKQHAVLETGDSIILLEDFRGKKICVNSAYVNRPNAEENAEEEEEQGAQIKEDLQIMDEVRANLRIVAGNFNADKEISPEEFTGLTEKEYVTDENDKKPTLFDPTDLDNEGTPRKAKHDYIFVQGRKKSIESIETSDVEILDRPSTHLPVRIEVTL